MGHRASVAYLRTDESVQAHYSHWGALDGRLAFGEQEITEAEPFGAGEAEPAQVSALKKAIQQGLGQGAVTVEFGGPDAGPVDAQAYWSGSSLSEWAQEGVDYLHHEAAYLVDTSGDSWDVRAFDTVWFEAPDREPGDADNPGTLVEIYEPDEWGDCSALRYADEWEDCATFAEFVNQLRDTIAEPERIPAFAPGGEQ
jgi:hypothetical protein